MTYKKISDVVIIMNRLAKALGPRYSGGWTETKLKALLNKMNKTCENDKCECQNTLTGGFRFSKTQKGVKIQPEFSFTLYPKDYKMEVS